MLFGAFGPGSAMGDIRDWRFRLKAPRFYGHYLEEWAQVPDSDTEFFLSKAYLSVHEIERTKDNEIIALHCDPNEPDGKHALYKRGPHLHVVAAEDPIPHAHFSLNLRELDQVLSSVDALMMAMSEAIKMLDDQVLTLYMGD